MNTRAPDGANNDDYKSNDFFGNSPNGWEEQGDWLTEGATSNAKVVIAFFCCPGRFCILVCTVITLGLMWAYIFLPTMENGMKTP